MKMLTPAGELLAAIHDHLAADQPVPTMDKLAAEIGVTTRTVQSLMVDLRAADLVHTEKVGRRVTYRVRAQGLAEACSTLRTVAQVASAVREADA